MKEKFKGEFFFDSHHRLIYSTAACIYRVIPLGVASPRDGDDVAALVKIAAENKIPLTARGAGAGLTGSALGRGIIIDFSKYMHRILSIDSENRRVTVEPGVVQHELDLALKRFDLFFPPDPSSSHYCTIGGMIGNNASGAHSIKYGATRNYLEKISCILSNGQELQLTNRMIPTTATDQLNSIVVKTSDILKHYAEDLKQFFPKTKKNSSGYLLDGILHADRSIDMAQLMAASEGTLSLFTEIDLSVLPKPKFTGLTMLFFDSLEAAGDAVLRICQLHPSMLEIMEDTFINLVRNSAFNVGVPFPPNLKALLLVEFEADDPDELESSMESLDRAVTGPGKSVIASRRAVAAEEKDRLLRVRQAASPILNRFPPPLHPIRFIEDGVVPVPSLPHYIQGLHKIFDRHHISGVIFGHAGDGNIHVNPFMDYRASDFKTTLASIATETVELIKSFGGSLSGEHGDGLLRSAFLPETFGRAYSAFVDLKRIFDPENNFNPGKIVGGDHRKIYDDLRIQEKMEYLPLKSGISQAYIISEINKCSDCGACRAYCPVFMATRDECSSPRSKLKMIQAILLMNRISDSPGIGPVEKNILDLCIDCGTCLTECPSGVDVPLIIQAAKQSHLHTWGTRISDRLLTSTEAIGKYGAAFPELSNRMLEKASVRKLMKLLFGIETQRSLPAYSLTPLHKSALAAEDCMNRTASGYKIAYFPGCFSSYNDSTGDGAAILAVLLHHEICPQIPDVECCGVAKFAVGRIDSALEQGRRNVDVLNDFVDRGYQIVTGAPSCGLAMKSDYPKRLKTPQSKKVAGAVMDIHELLLQMFQKGDLDLQMTAVHLKIAIHQPCHMRSQGIGNLPEKILRLIPGLEISTLAPRCCGIAGTFGMKTDNYKLSMQIGKPLFIELKRISPDYIVSNCGACRMQLEQAVGIPSLHPVSLLAKAYNLLELPKGLELKKGFPG